MRVDIQGKKADDKVILSEIHLSFPDKGLIFIIGKSGAGKTSLLNIMNGLDTDFEGEVLFKNVTSTSNAYKKMVGIVYQDFNLIGSLSVKDNIFLGAQVAGQAIEEAEYMDILKGLEIQHLEQRDISMLSGGEKQRVAIARALLRKNQVLFADEPTGNLDEKSSENIYKIFKELSKERLVFLVTHDLQAARQYGDRIVEIRDGKIYEDTASGYKGNECSCTQEEVSCIKHKWRFHYIRQGLVFRRKKMTSMGVTMLTAMLCVFLTLGLYSGIRNMLMQIDSAILENDRFDICNALALQGKQSKGIEEEVLEAVSAYKFCSYAVGFYQTSIQLTADDHAVKTAYEYIENNVFYQQRYKDINGTLPKSADEIMIDETMALQLFDTIDCVGKTLTLEVGELNKTVLVAGVKKAYQTKEGSGSVFIVGELIDEIYTEMTRGTFFISRQDSEAAQEDCMAFVAADAITDGVQVIQGKSPAKEGEVVIDVSLANQILTDLNLSGTLYSEEEIKNGTINDILFSAELTLLTMDLVEITDVRIVGITENEYGNSMLYYGDWYHDVQQRMTSMSLFVKDLSEDTLTAVADFSQQFGLYYEQNAKALSSIIRNQVSIAIFGLGLTSIMIFIIAGLMIHLFMKLSIIERRYEMGVLVSLGSTGKDIVSLLLCEQVMTAGVICLILDAVCFFVGGFFSMGIVKYNGLVIFCAEWWHYVIIDAIVCAAMILFSLGDIVKISKENTAFALADKYR